MSLPILFVDTNFVVDLFGRSLFDENAEGRRLIVWRKNAVFYNQQIRC